MKTKSLNKLLTAIVLCSVLLVALPGIGIAAAQADDPLDIYGNANEDDTIDMRDFTYTARIILWLEDETTLADANYDGDVNVLDMTQIGLIILGRGSKLTLVDGADRIVTVNKPVEEIICGLHECAEAVKLLGATDKVVGMGGYPYKDTVIFPDYSDLPSIGLYYTGFDYEKIFELYPDLFIMIAPIGPAGPIIWEVEEKLEPEITVVYLTFYTPASLVDSMRKLRYILNTEEKGEEFIAWYEGVINDITEKTAGLSEEEKPRVYYEVYYDWFTFSDQPDYRDPLTMAGGINIAEDLPGTVFDIDPEFVMDQNPDVVIRTTYEYADAFGVTPCACGYEVDDPTEMQALRDAIMDRPELAEGDAVKAGRVYLEYWQFSAGSVRFFVGIAYMAKWFHPELFEDLDPQTIHQEYLTRFLDIDYDLDKHGVFVYPEP